VHADLESHCHCHATTEREERGEEGPIAHALLLPRCKEAACLLPLVSTAVAASQQCSSSSSCRGRSPLLCPLLLMRLRLGGATVTAPSPSPLLASSEPRPLALRLGTGVDPQDPSESHVERQQGQQQQLGLSGARGLDTSGCG
jgi:hypothetical protein